MEKIIEISDWIEKHSKEIIENIDQESVDVYNYLKEEFKKSTIKENHVFQFVYRSFYRIDNAGLTPDFKKEYFNILESYRTTKQLDFEKVLRQLFQFQNRKGQDSFQFSFVTKMFNTIDDSLPIYDSEVARMFSLSRPYQKEFDIKLHRYTIHFNTIKVGYEHIISNDLLPKTMKLFDHTFKNNNLSNMKKLDFIFWSAGKWTKNN